MIRFAINIVGTIIAGVAVAYVVERVVKKEKSQVAGEAPYKDETDEIVEEYIGIKKS